MWNAAKGAGYPYGPLTQLLILNGQRKDLLAGMRWSEINIADALWTIPRDRMKRKAEERRTHEVPLCPEAIKLLIALPRWNKGDYVFSTTGGEKPVNGFSKAKIRLDKLIEGNGGKVTDWVFHDLRRTMRTRLSALPVEDMIRELVIAHAKKGLHKVYDQHACRDEKRHCLELWEARLKSIVEPPPDNVTALSDRAERVIHSARYI